MSILFLNGTVIDGNGGLAERGALLVSDDGKIEAVGPTTSLEGRRHDDGVTVVDLDGRSLLPGLIDTHVHLAGGDFQPYREQDPVGLAAFRTVEAATRTLQAGFTTIRAAGSRDFIDVDLRDAINEGSLVGPRLLASGRGLTTTGGHYYNWCAVEVDGVDAVRREVRNHIKRGVDSIKLMLSPGVATEGAGVDTEQFTLEEAQVAVYEAHKAGRQVLSHAISLVSIRNGIDAGVDSIDHGYYLDEEQALRMKERGIYLVPTFGPTYYYVHERKAEPWRIERAIPVEPIHAQAFKTALEVGVKIAQGCDCGAQSRMPNGENAREIELMVKHGMAPMAAILAATREAATLIKRIDQIGTLEPGKIADLIVVEGNPVDDVTRLRHGIQMVVQSGLVRRDDLGLAAASPAR